MVSGLGNKVCNETVNRKGEREGDLSSIFLTNFLTTKTNQKMEGVDRDQPNILESIFLGKFLMCTFSCAVKVIQI